MSNTLYRLGRAAARHPWRVLGAWLVVSILVIMASATVGESLKDTTAVPGLDSQEAIDLLTAAQSDSAGLRAEVVVAAPEGTTFFESAEARAAC